MSAIAPLKNDRDAILVIAAKHGADDVRIFGSVARGETDANDVDILVRLQPGRSLLDHVALQQDLEELLGCPVDVVVEGGVSPHLEQRILAEAVPL